MRINKRIVIDIASGAILERESADYGGPLALVLSAGGSSGQSKSSSKTNFPRKFFDEAFDYFGQPPKYAPEYTGFSDFDKLEENQYGSQKSRLDTAYQDSLKRQREELSQAGLLNSPNQYLEGGARSSLDKSYITNLQQAARDASSQSLTTKEAEAARKTEYSTETQKALVNYFLQMIGLAASAGRTSKGSSSSSGFNVGILT